MGRTATLILLVHYVFTASETRLSYEMKVVKGYLPIMPR